ncbi:DNA damage-inducible protein 1 [Binucleata daphniae]
MSISVNEMDKKENIINKDYDMKDNNIKHNILNIDIDSSFNSTLNQAYSTHNLATPKTEFVSTHSATIEQTPNIKTYSGDTSEDLKLWLRQFKFFPILYKGITQQNLHIYAASHLQGTAATYYDNLELEPRDFAEFSKLMEKRFTFKQMNKTTLYHTVLTQKQNINETTKAFCEKIYQLGTESGMDEEIIVQSIINNMITHNKTLYKLHLQNNMTYKALNNLIMIIEQENQASHTEIKNHMSNLDTNYNKSDTSMSKTEQILEKLSQICLNTQTTQKRNERKTYLSCNICGQQGHSENSCYKNISQCTENKEMRTTSDNDFKIQKLEKILGYKIYGTMEEFTKKIILKYPTCENILKVFPKHFNVLPTLRRNEFLLNELLKALHNNNLQVNTVKLQNKTFKYEITQTEIKIDDRKINAIIDTGANVSIISYKLATELNLPMRKNTTNQCIALANDLVVKTNGKITNCMLEINDSFYAIELIILDNAAQELLLGTDFLGRHKAIIDCEKATLRLKQDDDENFTTTQIKFKQISDTPIQNFEKIVKNLKLYAKEKRIITLYTTSKGINSIIRLH